MNLRTIVESMHGELRPLRLQGFAETCFVPYMRGWKPRESARLTWHGAWAGRVAQSAKC